ncbi:hypothetical protein [Rhizobacter sp. LjRoot28]|uniref:hypothetical protein n=1 Tax=Rhizobacter sp. LjRoot28 TaxID=3342309 RepID=UPI003ED01D7E
MSPTEIRQAPARAVLRKTPPQGLRLRRFKRQLVPGLLRSNGAAPGRSGGLRKPSVLSGRV